MNHQKKSINILSGVIFRLLVFVLIGGLYSQDTEAQQVQVNLMIRQPVTPYLPQLASEIQNGQYDRLEGSITDKMSISITNVGQTPKNIKLSARIERLAPLPAAAYLRPDYQPSRPITLGANQMIQLTRQNIEEAFGNFSRRYMIMENLDLDQLRNNQVNYKLPEGTYRACVAAYDYDRPGQSVPLSPLPGSCVTFNICYTLSAPQFTMPISTMMGRSGSVTSFTPNSQQITFGWTAPQSTCGLPTGTVTYDLEMREIIPGMTPNDAKLGGPIVFRKQNLLTNQFILDTLMYPNVFRAGKKYIVRVKANIQKIRTSPIEIANQGYSEIAALEYTPRNPYSPLGKVTLPEGIVQNPPDESGTIQVPPGITIVPTSGETPKPLAMTMPGACEAVPPVSDAPVSTESIVNKDLTVGGFVLHVNQATLTDGDLFRGSGYVIWTPYGKQLQLKVTFDGIRVNTDGQVIMGDVNTTSDESIPQWANLEAPDNIPYLSNAVNNELDNVTTQINRVANPIRQVMGDAPVNFPLGLNEQNIAGVKSTLAIMGITFTSKGTNMRVLFNMNIPEANGWLSLAGTNFCIKPDGFNFNQGTLYLPEDKTISFGAGYKLRFRKSEFDAETGEVVTDGKTHLSWTPDDGLNKVVIDGELEFSKNAIVAVNAERKRTGESVKMNLNFDFEKWDDWIANVSFSDDFEIASLSGFTIKSGTGMYYDHSKNRNPDVLSDANKFPMGYASKGGTTDKTFQGFYMGSLKMLFPEDFVLSNSAVIDVNNMIVDDAGVTLRVEAKDIVKEGDGGSLGGWGFTVDTVYIPIVRNNIYEQMGMNGSVWLPVSSTPLVYNCVLNKGSNEDEGLGYAFNIHPEKNLQMPMWKAVMSITDDSGFKIEKKPGKDVEVNASLNGDISIAFNSSETISVSVDLPLLAVKNLNISNKDGFQLDVESLTLGGVEVYKGNESEAERKAHTTGIIEDLPYGYFAYGGGPSPQDIGWNRQVNYPERLDADDESKGHIAGFGVTIKNFELKHPKPGQSVGLFFDLGVDLGFGDASVLSGGTNLGVVAAYQILGGAPKISFDGVAVDKVWLNGKFGPIGLRGELEFWSNDAIYGDGVHGKIAADFLVGNFDAQVYFGTKGDIHYGGAGGKFFTEYGIPLFGGLTINGFGGGYYSNMNTDMEAMKKSIASSGSEASDIGLKPVKNASHYDVTIIAAYANPTIVNVTLSVGIDSKNGGISSMTLTGDGHVITTPGNYSSGLVDAHVDMLFDFERPQFDATFTVDVNYTFVEAYIPIWMHGGPDGYKLWVGQPSDRVTAQMGFDAGVVYAKLKATAYICMGAGQGMLPEFPGLPSKITTFLNKGGSHQVQKMPGSTSPETNSAAIVSFLKENATGGFMFGASVEAELGLEFFVFYAKANGMIGFDLAMVETKPGSTGACNVVGNIGYKGYYAIGQMYAYFGMDVGVHLGIGDLPLVSVQLGAYLKGGLPNPAWGEGKVGLNAKILGVFEVNEVVDFDFGTKCYPEYNPLEHINFISEVTTEDIGIFDYPYVVFNVPVGEGGFKNFTDPKDFDFAPGVVSYPNPPDENHSLPFKRFYGFRSTFTPMKATKNASDSYSEKNVTYTNGYTVGTYKKDIEFSPETEYSFDVTVTAYQYQEYEKTWKEVTTQTKTVKFTTKKAGMELDKKQIAFAYPINGQRNFLKKEFGAKGFVQLNQGIKEERIPVSSGEYNPIAQFIPDNGEDTLSSTMTYDKSRKRFSFPIPAQMKNNTGYQVRLTMVPKDALKLMEQELKTETSFVELSLKTNPGSMMVDRNIAMKTSMDKARQPRGGQSNPEPATPPINNLITKTENKVSVQKASEKYGIKIFSVDFHTSAFDDFAKKMTNVSASYALGAEDTDYEWIPGVWKNQYHIYDLTFSIPGPEGFDRFETEPFRLDYGDNDQRETVYQPLLNLQFDRTLSNADFDKGTNNWEYKFDQIKNNSNQTWAWYNIYRYQRLGNTAGGGVPDIAWGLSHERQRDIYSGDVYAGALDPVYEFKSLNKIYADYAFKAGKKSGSSGLVSRAESKTHGNNFPAGYEYEYLAAAHTTFSGGPSAEAAMMAGYQKTYGKSRSDVPEYNAPITSVARGNSIAAPATLTVVRMPESYNQALESSTAVNITPSVDVDIMWDRSAISEVLATTPTKGIDGFKDVIFDEGITTWKMPTDMLSAKLSYKWTRDRYYFFDYMMVRMALNKYIHVNLSYLPGSGPRESLTTVEGYSGAASYYSRRIFGDGFFRVANYYGSMREVMEGWGHAEEYWADIKMLEFNINKNYPYGVYDFLGQPAPAGAKYSFEYEIPFNKSGQYGAPANQGEQPVKVFGNF